MITRNILRILLCKHIAGVSILNKPIKQKNLFNHVSILAKSRWCRVDIPPMLSHKYLYGIYMYLYYISGIMKW